MRSFEVRSATHADVPAMCAFQASKSSSCGKRCNDSIVGAVASEAPAQALTTTHVGAGACLQRETLAKRPDRDPSRADIEFYRRGDVIDLLLPVR